jgi:hypothetical protein
MATGAAGSTFTGELNRLANGGTYPVYTVYKASQGAALNYKASSSRQPNDYKGLNAICNELAGTSGLSAVVALRSIDL